MTRRSSKRCLLSHVVKGKIAAAQVVKLTSAKTLEGGSLVIHVTNGKVHVINKVPIPAS
ncbi:MAG: fasciclin domain-containing protein [Solirubrobacteraceae bacterium]